MEPTEGCRESPGLPILASPEELEARVLHRLIRIHHGMERRIGPMLARRGLSTAQLDVLATLRFVQGITQQELADRLLVTKGNVCGLIDRMEAAGWLERRPDPEDRRANRLFLTDGGRAKLDETIPDHRALVKDLLGGLGAEELRALDALLQRLEGVAKD